MAEPKTRPRAGGVREFLAGVEPERRRECRELMTIMREVTGEQATMWGASIVGFGKIRYRYGTGREGQTFLTGFSPRKRDLTVYVMSGFSMHAALLRKLGPHRTGKACLYLRSLDGVDRKTLTQLIRRSVKQTAKTNV